MSCDKPMSAADERPNGEPYYIDSTCDCGTELVLNDEHRPTGDGTGALVAPEVWDERDDTIWHDEWVCPECEDGLHMDWPDSESNALTDRMDSDEWLTTEEVREALGL